MVTNKVEISILVPTVGKLSKQWLRKIILKTLAIALPNEPCEIGLAICDDETIKDLNLRYRGINKVTDVLAFSTHHSGPWEGEGPSPISETRIDGFILPPTQLPYLGDTIVSYPQMSRQAACNGNSTEKELALLITHGILHLIGYNHEKSRELLTMETKQQEVLNRILLDG